MGAKPSMRRHLRPRRSALNSFLTLYSLLEFFFRRCKAAVPVEQARQTQAPKQDYDDKQRQAQE